MRLLLLLIILLTVEAKRKKSKSSKSSLPQAPLPPPPQMAENEREKYPIPVDFMNIRKMGVYDPSSGLKEPFDIVPRHMRLPKSPEEELEWVRNADPTKLFKIKGDDRRAPEPKEEKPLSIREYNPNLEEGETSNVTNAQIDIKMPELFDLETIQNLNFASPIIYRLNIAKGEAKFKRNRSPGYDRQIYERRRVNINNVSNAFPGGSFRLKEDRTEQDLKNWTTCDEFSTDARFHPREVAGVRWVAFYAWSPNPYPRYYDYFFSYPTATIVEEYKSNYRRYLSDAIDWSQPMLLLKAWNEILLIADDRKGLFHGIPKTEIPEQVKESSFHLKPITMRLKVLDPYLAIMLCEEKIGLMLAVAGEEPPIEKMEAEAATLGFRGIGEILVRDTDDMEEVQVKKTIAKEAEEEGAQEEDIVPRRHSPFFRDDSMFL